MYAGMNQGRWMKMQMMAQWADREHAARTQVWTHQQITDYDQQLGPSARDQWAAGEAAKRDQAKLDTVNAEGDWRVRHAQEQGQQTRATARVNNEAAADLSAQEAWQRRVQTQQDAEHASRQSAQEHGQTLVEATLAVNGVVNAANGKTTRKPKAATPPGPIPSAPGGVPGPVGAPFQLPPPGQVQAPPPVQTRQVRSQQSPTAGLNLWHGNTQTGNVSWKPPGTP